MDYKTIIQIQQRYTIIVSVLGDKFKHLVTLYGRNLNMQII